jgi:hypothetical protein
MEDRRPLQYRIKRHARSLERILEVRRLSAMALAQIPTNDSVRNGHACKERVLLVAMTQRFVPRAPKFLALLSSRQQCGLRARMQTIEQ